MKTMPIDPQRIRHSPFAGTWYPGSKRELQETVDGFLAAAEWVPTDEELVALIAPHAGYPYSGATAACAYRQLAGRTFDLVVLLGPSHSDDLGPLAVSSKEFYATPLGEVELDQEFLARLQDKLSLTHVDQDHEHSLEIQLPFLQRTLGTFKLAPLMVTLPFYILGPQVRAHCERAASALAECAAGRRVLFVASSDLSHLPDYDAVNRQDARTAELVAAFDLPALVEYFSQAGECRACGDAPVVIVLDAAQRLGASHARVLRRTTSGDVTGIRTPGQYTVGYMAAAVYKTAPPRLTSYPLS